MEGGKRDDTLFPMTDQRISSQPAATDGGTREVARNSIIGATSGAVFGTVLATYRGHSVPFYAASMGTNYALASLAFFGTEALIRKARGDKRDALGYAGAGLTTGMAMTLPIGGRYQALVAGIAMAGAGYGGFHAHRSARAYLDELGQEELRRREKLKSKGRNQANGGPSKRYQEQR